MTVHDPHQYQPIWLNHAPMIGSVAEDLQRCLTLWRRGPHVAHRCPRPVARRPDPPVPQHRGGDRTMTGDASPTKITLHLDAHVDLTPEQVWPDGVPESWTVDDVAVVVGSAGSVESLISDWCIPVEVDVTTGTIGETLRRRRSVFPIGARRFNAHRARSES